MLRSNSPAESRGAPRRKIVDDTNSQKGAHPRRVCSHRRCVKASGFLSPNRPLAVSMPAMTRERAEVITSRVKSRPSGLAEIRNLWDVGIKASRLRPIHLRKLALVAGDCDSQVVAESLSKAHLRLPNTGRLTSVCPAQILWMVENAPDHKAFALRGLR